MQAYLTRTPKLDPKDLKQFVPQLRVHLEFSNVLNRRFYDVQILAPGVFMFM